MNELAKLNLDNKEIHGKGFALVSKMEKGVEETKESKRFECTGSTRGPGFDNSAAASTMKTKEEKGKKVDMIQLL